MRSKSLAAIAIGAVTAVMLPLAVPTSSWAADGSAAAPAEKPSQAQWKSLDAASKKHSALGVFGVDSDSGPVLTLPAGTSAGKKAEALADIPAGMKVTVRTSRFTKNELDSIEKVVGEAKWHKDANKYGLGSFYDGETDKVVVNTDAPESVTASLKSSYGDKIKVVQSRFEQQNNRFNDSQPFWGGDSIHTDSSGACTAGWHLRATNPENNQTADFLTSAGHCYVLNELVKGADNEWMGWVKRFGEIDGLGFLGYQYGDLIWTGTFWGSTASRVTRAYSAMYNGLQVCVSGQTSYQHCGHPITSTNYGFSWSDHNGHSHWNSGTYGFAWDRGSNGTGPVTQGGDSGAPVHTPWPQDDDNTSATGTHSGLVSWYDAQACGCMQYRMYGVKMQGYVDSWGATLQTG